jgi:hypothetical protein
MHTMHLLPGLAVQPNLELKTRPKQLLGSLLLVIAHPTNRDLSLEISGYYFRVNFYHFVPFRLIHYRIFTLRKYRRQLLDAFKAITIPINASQLYIILFLIFLKQ